MTLNLKKLCDLVYQLNQDFSIGPSCFPLRTIPASLEFWFNFFLFFFLFCFSLFFSFLLQWENVFSRRFFPFSYFTEEHSSSSFCLWGNIKNLSNTELSFIRTFFSFFHVFLSPPLLLLFTFKNLCSRNFDIFFVVSSHRNLEAWVTGYA